MASSPLADKNPYLEPEQRLRHVPEATLRRVHETKMRIIAKIGELGTVAAVARALNVSASTIWRYRRDDSEFRSALEEQVDAIGALVENSAIEKVLTPGTKTVYFQGELCGVEIVHHDALHLALLRGLRPERYRENSGINLNIQNAYGMAILPIASATDDDWEQASKQLTDMQNRVASASAGETIEGTGEEIVEPLKRGG